MNKMSLSHVFTPKVSANQITPTFLSLACIHYSLPTPHVWFFRENTITKRTPRHPYCTRSKSRMMGDQEETQEHMKVYMSALKEQMASMMEAMLGMRQLMLEKHGHRCRY